jgi:hypothetical protein
MPQFQKIHESKPFDILSTRAMTAIRNDILMPWYGDYAMQLTG